MLPALAVVIVTYNRAAVLRETLRRLVQHVQYAGEHIAWVIADDGSDDGTQDMLNTLYPSFVLVQSNRAGLGANTNAGLRAAFTYSPFVLQLQDDMQPLKRLDLAAHVQRLAQDETAGFIRLWGVAGHTYHAELSQNYWCIRYDSPEHYIASDRPHIKHRRFHEAFGFYPEGKSTGDTEEAWCHQVKTVAYQNSQAPSVLVPLGHDTETSWEHVCWGERWRDKGL